jgi:hypothetical protein
MSKATKSQDGVLRFTLPVQFRVGRNTLINALLACEGEPKTRREALRMAQSELYHHGVNLRAIVETVDRAHATEIIDRLFPELTT